MQEGTALVDEGAAAPAATRPRRPRFFLSGLPTNALGFYACGTGYRGICARLPVLPEVLVRLRLSSTFWGTYVASFRIFFQVQTDFGSSSLLPFDDQHSF